MGDLYNRGGDGRKAGELWNGGGSYAKYVVREADAEPELVQYNKDGTEKVDDGRRIEKVGDAAVLFDADGNELERCDWNAHVWGTCAAWAAAHPKPCD